MSATTHVMEHLQHRRTVFDGWRSIFTAILLTIVGYAVLVGVPVISTAWVGLLGFSEEQVGRVAGADLGGLSLGAVLTSLLVGGINRRWLALCGAGLAIASNALCMEFQLYEQVLWLRVGAGMGVIFFTYIDIGSYWTYIELAALDAGVNQDFVGPVLVWGSLLTGVGCLVVTLISNRFGLARPLLMALLAMASVACMLSNGITEGKLLVSVFGFNLLWIFVDVYQMSTVANIDHSGSFAALIPGAQGLGQIIGPNIAASLLGAGLGYGVVFKMSAVAALTGMLIFALTYLWLRRNISALADSP